jgi:hypothetical protein
MIGRLAGTIALLAVLTAANGEPTKPIADPATNPVTGSRPDQKVAFPAIKDFSTLRIGLTRTACYGWCPVYRLEIAGDGTVTWFGERFVEAKGARSVKISVEKVRALYDAFAKADFFWTFDDYRAPITDLPTQIISISFDGHAKTLEDYAGGRVGMPKAIDDLEAAVDEAAGAKAWIGNTREP